MRILILVLILFSYQKVERQDSFEQVSNEKSLSDNRCFKRTIQTDPTYYGYRAIYDTILSHLNEPEYIEWSDINDNGYNDIIDALIVSSNRGIINYEVDFDCLDTLDEYSSQYSVSYNCEMIIDGVLYLPEEQPLGYIDGFAKKWLTPEHENGETHSLLLIIWTGKEFIQVKYYYLRDDNL